MPCKMCTDPDGEACYPQYGIAPHRHDLVDGKPFMPGMGTHILPVDQWPDNFVLDEESGGVAGTWYCPHCREGLD